MRPVSRTDPDARLCHKPGQRKHLVHRGQVAVVPQARVIVAVEAERATGSEADALEGLIGRARFAGHTVAEVAADAGYASQESYRLLERLKTIALIPSHPGAKHQAAIAARERMQSRVGRDAAFERQAHAEGAISELKRHGADRARCRGTRLVQLRLLVTATAINLKRLIAAQDIARGAGQQERAALAEEITPTIRALTVLLGLIDRTTATDHDR